MANQLHIFVFALSAFQVSLISAQMIVSPTMIVKNFDPYFNSKLDMATVGMTVSVSNEIECCFSCTTEPSCLSYNFKLRRDSVGKHTCELLPADKYNNSQYFTKNSEFHHFAIKSPCREGPCQNGGSCFPQYEQNDYVCSCTKNYWGRDCHIKVMKSCAEYKTAGLITTGVYPLISPDGLGRLNVYCDMSPQSNGGGWTMVFKAHGGFALPKPATVWTTVGTRNEHVVSALDVSNSLNDHYKNRIVDQWTTFNPTWVRLVLYTAGKESLSMLFNAMESNSSSWFEISRVQASPWIDLKTEPKNRFTLNTDIIEKRQFIINRNFGGCPADNGWLMVTHSHCAYETRLPVATIMYSKATTFVNWQKETNVGVADVLVIYIR